MKKWLLALFFVVFIIVTYAYYFHYLINIFGTKASCPQLLVNNILRRGVIYFKKSDRDSSLIKVFKFSGFIDDSNKIALIYQSSDYGLDNNISFQNNLIKIVKKKNALGFLFDYSHPINNDILHVINKLEWANWIENKQIYYLEDYDWRHRAHSYESIHQKIAHLFYYFPLGQFLMIILVVLVIRVFKYLFLYINNYYTKNLILFLLCFLYVSIIQTSFWTVDGDFLRYMNRLAIITLLILIISFYLLLILSNNLTKDLLYKNIILSFGILIVPNLLCMPFGALFDYSIFGSFTYTLWYHGLHNRLLNIFLMATWPFVSAFFINSIFSYISKKRNTLLLLESQRKEAEYKSAELDSLMARINPHFLFNGLNSIASLTKLDSKKAESMAIELANFYRYASNRENKIYAKIKDELELLLNYIKLEKMRFGDFLEFNIHCDEEIMTELIPYMIVQPIIENAIKYGYSAKTNSISIVCRIELSNSNIILRIYDNGKPFDESLQYGFGLHSINRKLELLYDSKAEIKFINSPNKHVYLQIPRFN